MYGYNAEHTFYSHNHYIALTLLNNNEWMVALKEMKAYTSRLDAIVKVRVLR